MPVTRSATSRTRNRSAVDQPPSGNQKKCQPTQKAKSTTTRKRVASPDDKDATSTSKKQKTSQTHESADLDAPILINRSPVLQLWGASVAQLTHPDLSWTICLSIGGAIATLCAVSKGRAVGKIVPKDDTDKDKHRTKDSNLKVMGFPMAIENGVVVVNGKPKPLKESLLQNKYGEGHYDLVRDTMQAALESWRDSADELNAKAFHMYEQFRPSVASGGAGWGRKGELNLDKIKSVVAR